MNIFVLDTDPKLAAQYHCDKHVVKMVLESAQILCTSVNLTGGEAKYKTTHENHPCSLWARATKANFDWLKECGLALCEEYTRRYGKRHKSQSVIESATNETIPDGNLQPFALAMPDIYKVEDPVASYRQYYKCEKGAIAKWKMGNIPEWFAQGPTTSLQTPARAQVGVGASRSKSVSFSKVRFSKL